MPANLRISEAASLGLHAIVMLAQEPKRALATKDISAFLKVSNHHLAKVLQRLARAGLVDSQRGPRGGFKLARRGSAITLLEVYEAVDGPLDDDGCLLGKPACNGDCMLGGLVHKMGWEVRQYLAGTTLQDLVAGPAAGLSLAGAQ